MFTAEHESAPRSDFKQVQQIQKVEPASKTVPIDVPIISQLGYAGLVVFAIGLALSVKKFF